MLAGFAAEVFRNKMLLFGGCRDLNRVVTILEPTMWHRVTAMHACCRNPGKGDAERSPRNLHGNAERTHLLSSSVAHLCALAMPSIHSTMRLRLHTCSPRTDTELTSIHPSIFSKSPPKLQPYHRQRCSTFPNPPSTPPSPPTSPTPTPSSPSPPPPTAPPSRPLRRSWRL